VEIEISSEPRPVEALTKPHPAGLAGFVMCGLCGIAHGDNSALSLSSIAVVIGISDFGISEFGILLQELQMQGRPANGDRKR